jgi:perosamine synthetase
VSPVPSWTFEVPPTAGLPARLADLLPPYESDLASALAGFLGVEEVQLECSGTAALVVALTALRPGSRRTRVVVPAFTCPLVPLAIVHCGLEVVPCDTAPGSFDFDEDELARLCDADTLAVVPTHLGGRLADVGVALSCARRCGAFVIEDAAQALGARQDGCSVGLSGDAGFFSLAAGKGLSTFEGGALITRDEDLRARLRETSRRIVPRRVDWGLRRAVQMLGYAVLYRPRLLPLAYGLPLRRRLRRGELLAAAGDDLGPSIPLHRLGPWRRAVARRAVDRLGAFHELTSRRAVRRVERLERIAPIEVVRDRGTGTGVWPVFMVLASDPGMRDRLLGRLWPSGLGVGRMFLHALPDHPACRACVPASAVPRARDLAARMLTISNSPWLDDLRFEQLCRTIEEVTLRGSRPAGAG